MPGMIRLAALHARQPHLGGAEEQRIDLVEIAVVPLEDVVERRPVIFRRRRGDLRNQLGQLSVIGLDGITRLAAVQDAVVGATDRPEIGRTNDCILYGGQARYTIQADDAELAELVPKIP